MSTYFYTVNVNLEKLFLSLSPSYQEGKNVKVILCQIKIICHQLTQDMTTEIQYTILQGLNFRTICVNLSKSFFVFWVNW